MLTSVQIELSLIKEAVSQFFKYIYVVSRRQLQYINFLGHNYFVEYGSVMHLSEEWNYRLWTGVLLLYIKTVSVAFTRFIYAIASNVSPVFVQCFTLTLTALNNLSHFPFCRSRTVINIFKLNFPVVKSWIFVLPLIYGLPTLSHFVLDLQQLQEELHLTHSVLIQTSCQFLLIFQPKWFRRRLSLSFQD